MRAFIIPAPVAIALLFSACLKLEEPAVQPPSQPQSRQLHFDVTVTRGDAGADTKSTAYEMSEGQLKMNPDIPFGLVGVDIDTHSLLIDNTAVSQRSSGAYSAYLDNSVWEIPAPVTFSAYYPYVRDVRYGDGYETYTIPYSVQETEAGPLVSKTVQMAVDQMNLVPLEFQHITNDIGYKICDVTEDPQLQGLIHLRKVTATRVAQAGVFVNDITLSQGIWHRQGYYRDIVVFDGDARVGVGSPGELFIGEDQLVPHKYQSSRYYSVPDEILMGKQTVEVVYDVDGFTVDGFSYPPLQGLVGRFSLYGLLPDNTFVYGKQYTFHLGLDLGKVYQAVAFDASVSDWETRIYEDNEDF